MKTWILLVAIASMGATAQDVALPMPPEPQEAGAQVSVAVDTAKALRDGAAAAEAENQPRYRNREPMRSAGAPKEQTTGGVMPISPDKTTRGGGDW